MADEKPSPKPQPEAAPQAPDPRTRPVAEREPLTVTVLDTPTADVAVQAETQVQVPTRVERPPVPAYIPLIVGLAAALLLGVYRLQFAPLILRFEHGLQRRIYGEREYDAHRDPKARGVAIRPGG